MAAKANKRSISLNYSKETKVLVEELLKKGFINAVITNKKHKKKTLLLSLKYSNSFSAISSYSLNSKTSYKRVVSKEFTSNKLNFIENILYNDKIRKKKYLLTRLR